MKLIKPKLYRSSMLEKRRDKSPMMVNIIMSLVQYVPGSNLARRYKQGRYVARSFSHTADYTTGSSHWFLHRPQLNYTVGDRPSGVTIYKIKEGQNICMLKRKHHGDMMKRQTLKEVNNDDMMIRRGSSSKPSIKCAMLMMHGANGMANDNVLIWNKSQVIEKLGISLPRKVLIQDLFRNGAVIVKWSG